MSDADDDLGERLRRLGFRVGRDALAAFLAHVHKSRLGPTETLEQLADLEERARAAVNLARRTRFACIGAFKPLDRFDWNHPEKIDRALVDRLVELDFVDRGENVLLSRAAVAWARRPSRSTSASPRSPPATPSGSRRWPPPSLTCSVRNPYRPSTAASVATLAPTCSSSTSWATCRATAAPPTSSTPSSAAATSAPPPSSPPTSPSSSGAPSSPAPPASSPSSTASRSTVTASRSSAPPGATSTAWTPTTGRRPAPTGHDVSARDLVDRQITSDPRCRLHWCSLGRLVHDDVIETRCCRLLVKVGNRVGACNASGFCRWRGVVLFDARDRKPSAVEAVGTLNLASTSA